MNIACRHHIPFPYDAEVEYLRGDGQARIDIGIKAKSGMLLRFRCRKVNVTGAGAYIVIGNTGWQDKSMGVMDAGYYPRICYGSKVKEGTDLSQDTQLKTYEFRDNEVYVNGELYYTFVKQTFESKNNIMLFADANFSSTRVWNGELYDVYIEDRGVAVRDMIAVRKDGTGYFYDRVSGQLFCNSGTGSFIIGPDKRS